MKTKIDFSCCSCDHFGVNTIAQDICRKYNKKIFKVNGSTFLDTSPLKECSNYKIFKLYEKLEQI